MSWKSLIKRSFKPLLKKAGMPKEVRFYDLRHTFATLMLEQGENPKDVQEILGHSRIDVTMNVYAHVLPHIQEEAMDRFAEKLRDTRSTPASS